MASVVTVTVTPRGLEQLYSLFYCHLITCILLKMYYFKPRFAFFKHLIYFSAMEEMLIHKGQSTVIEFLSKISTIDAQMGSSKHQHVTRRVRSKDVGICCVTNVLFRRKCKSDVNRLRQ